MIRANKLLIISLISIYHITGVKAQLWNHYNAIIENSCYYYIDYTIIDNEIEFVFAYGKLHTQSLEAKVTYVNELTLDFSLELYADVTCTNPVSGAVCVGDANALLSCIITVPGPGLYYAKFQGAICSNCCTNHYEPKVFPVAVECPAGIAIDDNATSVNPVSCLGSDDGSIEIDLINSSQNTNISWYHMYLDEATNSTKIDTLTYSGTNPTNLSEGYYYVVVQDDTCFSTRTFWVSASYFDFEVQFKSECDGDNKGEIEIVSISKMPGGLPTGTSYFSFSWSNTKTGYKITKLTEGGYEVTISDGTCTRGYNSVFLEDNVTPVFDLTTELANCPNTNGSAQVSVDENSLIVNGANYAFGELSITWKNEGDIIGNGTQIDNLGIGNYSVSVQSDGSCPSIQYFTLECEAPPCLTSCISSFAPHRGKQYVLSAWVMENSPAPVTTYSGPQIRLLFPDAAPSLVGPFGTSVENPIIDGWQQINAVFFIPSSAVFMEVELLNSGGNDVFFDDIRIHPFNANMSSFVYDPVSLRHVATLDENNFATFYEHDAEGQLIRVKKETERGVMTIQESRAKSAKSTP